MTETDSESEPIAPFVALLGAHIDLISDTSEETAMHLSEGLAELRKSLLDIASSGQHDTRLSKAIERASELQSVLQTQDILRQQVVAVRDGLLGLSPLKADDVMCHINGLKDGYVMPQQWDVHARVTGEDVSEEPGTDTDGPVFF